MEDNPDFTGSNPTSRISFMSPVSSLGARLQQPCQTDLQTYRWDVDNDGDGVADSISVDLGLPVRAAKDGKLYKPLLDPVRGHGRAVEISTPTEFDEKRIRVISSGRHSARPAHYPDNFFANHTALPTNRGRGFGPAEINLITLDIVELI